MTIKLSSTYYTHIFTSNIPFEWMGLVSFHFYTHMIFTQYAEGRRGQGAGERKKCVEVFGHNNIYMNIIWNVRILCVGQKHNINNNTWQQQQQQKRAYVCIRFTSIIKLLDQKGKYHHFVAFICLVPCFHVYRIYYRACECVFEFCRKMTTHTQNRNKEEGR